jgi:hypothetical protein
LGQKVTALVARSYYPSYSYLGGLDLEYHGSSPTQAKKMFVKIVSKEKIWMRWSKPVNQAMVGGLYSGLAQEKARPYLKTNRCKMDWQHGSNDRTNAQKA